MGAGISSMHYIGMAAMRLPAVCGFNSFLVVQSVVLAVLISLAALWITFHFRDEKKGSAGKASRSRRDGCRDPRHALHGHARWSFTPSGMPVDLSHAASISILGTAGIAAVTFMVLGLALLTSRMDRRFAAQTLEAYLSEAQRLSHTGSFGCGCHRRDHLVRGNLSNLPVRPNDATDRGTCASTWLIRKTLPSSGKRSIAHDTTRRTLTWSIGLLMPDGSVKHLRLMTAPWKTRLATSSLSGGDGHHRGKRAEWRSNRCRGSCSRRRRWRRSGALRGGSRTTSTTSWGRSWATASWRKGNWKARAVRRHVDQVMQAGARGKRCVERILAFSPQRPGRARAGARAVGGRGDPRDSRCVASAAGAPGEALDAGDTAVVATRPSSTRFFLVCFMVGWLVVHVTVLRFCLYVCSFVIFGSLCAHIFLSMSYFGCVFWR